MTIWTKIIIAQRKMEYSEIIIANNWIKDGTVGVLFVGVSSFGYL